MRLIVSLLFAGMIGSAAWLSAAELIVDIDFNDEVAIRSEPMTETEVATLVRELREAVGQQQATGVVFVRTVAVTLGPGKEHDPRSLLRSRGGSGHRGGQQQSADQRNQGRS